MTKVYRWIKVVLFSIMGAWLVNFLGEQAARSAAASFEGLATIVWVGDASSIRDLGTAYKGGAHARVRTWQDGAQVLIDGLSEPVMHRGNPNTLTTWLHAGDRVRVKYKRGTFLFWENVDIIKLTAA